MTIEAKTKLQPFRTPNFVLLEAKAKPRHEGFHETPKYHPSELDAATLDALCVQFREDIFKKAGKEDPEIRSK